MNVQTLDATAGDNSIDRFPENRQWTGIGTRHPRRDARRQSRTQAIPLPCGSQKPTMCPTSCPVVYNGSRPQIERRNQGCRFSHGQGTVPRCRGAGLQYHQKVNKDFGPILWKTVYRIVPRCNPRACPGPPPRLLMGAAGNVHICGIDVRFGTKPPRGLT